MIDIGGINVNNFNTSDKKILEVKNICKTYQSKNGEVEALKNINFDVKEGEFISIIGPSGCGKSTLLSIIAGLEDKTSGEIYIDGKMGYMLQRDNLLEWRTIYKNVLLGLEIMLLYFFHPCANRFQVPISSYHLLQKCAE